MPTATIVLDACIAISFGNSSAINVVSELRTHNIVIAARAVSEVTREPARSQLAEAIARGNIVVVAVDLYAAAEQDSLRRYEATIQFRGRGDAEVLALAESRGWIVGSDEIALQRAAKLLGEKRFAGTLDFLKLAVQETRLSAREAIGLLNRLDVGPALLRRVAARGLSIARVLTEPSQ